ncbi:MAG: KH domain RNA binding protein YlqC, partial [uncultured Rubrobacteraceae bacterium]
APVGELASLSRPLSGGRTGEGRGGEQGDGVEGGPYFTRRPEGHGEGDRARWPHREGDSHRDEGCIRKGEQARKRGGRGL